MTSLSSEILNKISDRFLVFWILYRVFVLNSWYHNHHWHFLQEEIFVIFSLAQNYLVKYYLFETFSYFTTMFCSMLLFGKGIINKNNSNSGSKEVNNTWLNPTLNYIKKTGMNWNKISYSLLRMYFRRIWWVKRGFIAISTSQLYESCVQLYRRNLVSDPNGHNWLIWQ